MFLGTNLILQLLLMESLRDSKSGSAFFPTDMTALWASNPGNTLILYRYISPMSFKSCMTFLPYYRYFSPTGLWCIYMGTARLGCIFAPLGENILSDLDALFGL